MRQLILMMLFSSAIAYAQQETIYKLKSNGKKLTKTQFDSLSVANNNNLQYSMKQEQGQTIMEIDLPSSVGNSKDKKTSDSDGAREKKITYVYLDTLNNVISAEDFQEKRKSGKYAFSYQLEDSKVTIALKNKAEKESADQKQNFRNKYINTPFPNFNLKKLDGTEVSLASLAGKTVVINFWFIGCKPCLAEMPLLNEVVSRYKDRADIVFLAPALDEQDKLIPFLDKHAFSYQVLSTSRELTKKLDFNEFPTHMILDQKGIIKEVMVGATEGMDKSLMKAIDKIAIK